MDSQQRYNRKIRKICDEVQRLCSSGEIESALNLLFKAYQDTQDDVFKGFIDQICQQAGINPQELGKVATVTRPLPQRKDPLQMLEEIKRKKQEGISTRRPQEDDVYTKTYRETIDGIGTFVREKVTKGWASGQRFSDTETKSFTAGCGCLLSSAKELGGICAVCNKPVCKNHLIQCFECHRPICSVHMRNIEDKPFCIRCFHEIEHKLTEETDQWLLDQEPPPKRWSLGGKKKKKLPPGGEESDG